MKVHFVFAPPAHRLRYGESWEGALPPLGILYLASYLRSRIEGLELRATDGLLKGMQGALSEIRTFGPDVLCISFYTSVALGAYKVINTIKREFPNMKVIVGGVHATALPEEALTRSAADVVVRGEGEQTLFELIKLLSQANSFSQAALKDIDGIAFLDEGGQVVQTATRRYIVDLDTIPFPAWDLLPMSDYRGYYLYQRTPEYSMLLSRGCPFDCTFCPNEVWKLSNPWVRLRSPRNVVDEMERLVKEHGIKEIQDVSDELNNNVRNALGICEEIKRRKLDVTWRTLARAYPLPEELVKAMAESGCWLASLGIETGNAETLNGIEKHFTIEQVEQACSLLHQYGIKVQGLFMLFNAWEQDGELEYETVEMCENTLRFAGKLADKGLLDYASWAIATPYPGSELYGIACRHGLIKQSLTGEWDSWIRDDPFVMKLPGISDNDQARLFRRASVLGVKCALSSGNVGARDVGLAVKKGMSILGSEVRARLRQLAP
jgi:anaerobic magnesium-protoporphyrin IX monomethyl ester cyclase